MNAKQFLAMLLLALSGDKTRASPEPRNQGSNPNDLKPTHGGIPTPTTTVLFEPIDGRHLKDVQTPSGLFSGSAKQAVAFQTPEQLITNPDLTNFSFTKSGPVMRVVEKSKHKVKTKKKSGKGRNLRENQNEANAEDDQEYTTVAMSSDDGQAYAHCAVYPDGKTVSCIQYVHNGVQNTTIFMIDPNEIGSHTLTTVTSDEQREYFKDYKMELPVEPEHEGESRRRALLNEELEPSQASLASRRDAAGVLQATMAVAVDPDTLSAFGGMDKTKAQIAIQVSLLNQVLQTSGLNLKINLVSVIQNPVNSNGDSYTDLIYATNNIDRGNADFLMSVVGNSGSSRAYQYNYRPADAQSLKRQLVAVVRYNMFPGKTFQHEFGHTIAGQHQPQYSYTSGRRFPNAYAYSDDMESIGTVLAYIWNPVDRFPVYSSATGTYDNVRVGAANLDNVGAMRITIPEIVALLANQNPGSTPTPKPTAAVYTAAPTKITPKPIKAPTKKATSAPVRTQGPTQAKTSSSKAPTVPSKMPTKQAIPSKAPTKSKAPTQRTKKPTSKPTAAPTFDQTPLLPVNKLVDFSFGVDANAPVVPLTIQIGPARKVTINNGVVTVINSANNAVGRDSYVVNNDVLAKINFGSGSDNNFRLINTGTEVNLYYVPMVRKKIKGKFKFVLGTPQLLLGLQKISATGNNMLGNDLPISFSRAARNFVEVGAIKNVATSKPVRGRLLADDPVPGAIINFIDFAKDPQGETDKLLSPEYESVLKVIADSSDNILKFIDDATFSLGEKEAYKLMNSGVMKKIFELADVKVLRKVFRQLHYYHKKEFIPYVDDRLIAQYEVFKKAAMQVAKIPTEERPTIRTRLK